jgi:site-specific recombinase XerD
MRNVMGRPLTTQNETAFRGLSRKLEAAGKSAKTIGAYHQGCLSLQRYLEHTGQDADLLAVSADQAAGWLIALQEAGGWSLSRDGKLTQAGRPMAKDSVVSYFGSVRRFFNWAVQAELIDASPMAGMDEPPRSGRPLDIPSEDDIRAVLATCRPPKGHKRSFTDCRDEFILRLLSETGGPRCSEVALLPMEHLDLRTDLVTICGKGGKWRRFPLSAPTAAAGQRYLQARKAHRRADLAVVFLGIKGPLTPDGVYTAVIRRSRMAGIDPPIHPHQYRHRDAHEAKTAGMSDGDMMTLFGWSSTAMLHRYGKALAEERAIEASRRLALAGRL